MAVQEQGPGPPRGARFSSGNHFRFKLASSELLPWYDCRNTLNYMMLTRTEEGCFRAFGIGGHSVGPAVAYSASEKPADGASMRSPWIGV